MNNFQITLIIIGLIIVALIIYLEISRRKQLKEESHWLDINKEDEADPPPADVMVDEYYDSTQEDEKYEYKYEQDYEYETEEQAYEEAEEHPESVVEEDIDLDDNSVVEEYKDEELNYQSKYDETYVLTVMAKGDDFFEGPDILREFIALNLIVDEDGHYHRPMSGIPNIRLFGVANIMRPGNFNPNNMLEFKTKGLMLYMRLPCKLDTIQAFEQFYDAADVLAVTLGGNVCDENRNRLSQYRLEQMRDKIRHLSLKLEVERKKHLQNK